MVDGIKLFAKKLLIRTIAMLRIAVMASVILFGIPLVYSMLPMNTRPSTIWEFTNSVLLSYLAILITARAFYREHE